MSWPSASLLFFGGIGRVRIGSLRLGRLSLGLCGGLGRGPLPARHVEAGGTALGGERHPESQKQRKRLGVGGGAGRNRYVEATDLVITVTTSAATDAEAKERGFSPRKSRIR